MQEKLKKLFKNPTLNPELVKTITDNVRYTNPRMMAIVNEYYNMRLRMLDVGKIHGISIARVRAIINRFLENISREYEEKLKTI